MKIELSSKLNNIVEVIKEIKKLLNKEIEVAIYEGYARNNHTLISLLNVEREELIEIKDELKKKVGNRIIRFENLSNNMIYTDNTPHILMNDNYIKDNEPLKITL